MATNESYLDLEVFEALTSNLDQFFLCIMGMCVLFMQAGFAFLEAGAVRSKNTTNIIIKNMFDIFVSGITYWIIGYALAFGEGNAFLGYSNFVSYNLDTTQFAMWFFQFTFAATAATIVSGAVAERCDFIAYLIYSFGITGFIYPIVTHWAWTGQGWLATGMNYGDELTVGYQDFAGSGVVHVLGGTAAFVAALILGPRIGRFDKKTGATYPIRGHSVPLAGLGGFILYFGFMAFNGGSQLTISSGGDGVAVSTAIMNTIISGAFSGATALLINRFNIFGGAAWSLLTTTNGALAGMVAICAGCNRMYPWGACVTGIIAAMSYYFWSWLVRKLRVDDPLDAVAVHFGGGTWGVIAVAFFDMEHGIVLNWDYKSAMHLAWQACGVCSIVGWTAATTLLMFGILRLLKMLRVSEEIEIKGLDIPKHGEPAYPVEAYGHGHIEKILQALESGVMEVTQGYHKITIERELTDNGRYESPEMPASTDAIKANGGLHNQAYEDDNGRDVKKTGKERNPDTRL